MGSVRMHVFMCPQCLDVSLHWPWPAQSVHMASRLTPTVCSCTNYLSRWCSWNIHRQYSWRIRRAAEYLYLHRTLCEYRLSFWFQNLEPVLCRNIFMTWNWRKNLSQSSLWSSFEILPSLVHWTPSLSLFLPSFRAQLLVAFRTGLLLFSFFL